MFDHPLAKWYFHFGSSSPEIIIRAPGRVNIIGEHTDYNYGWVLPGAIDKYIYIFISKSEQHHWIADDLNEVYKSSIDENDKKPLWVKYVYGTLELYNLHDQHFHILIGGDLPVGAGVSASSSLVCGLLSAFQKITGGNESKEQIALLASRIEREVIGLQGGIMDQYAIMLSQDKKVMMLDCRTRKYKFIPAELSGCSWILINTKVKHQLIDSDYNNRFDECSLAVVVIQKTFPLVKSLRDVTLEMLSKVKLEHVLFRRCKYVIEENERVHDMVGALEGNDPQLAGNILKKSHAGLRDEYEVSCVELDHLADFANNYEGVYGARMMGGGFGGCVLCLVSDKSMDDFLSNAVHSYTMHFGFEPAIIHFELEGGAEIVLINS